MSGKPSHLQRLAAYVSRLASRPLFSYLTILLLQIKVTWGMWRFRDLTWGDTSQYYIGAYNSHFNGTAPITWSPLYTSFYGFLMNFSPDAVIVTALHRWLIVIILCVMVLALMRRFLPQDIAWLMAAWWVVLPINFNTLYEVHLFAAIPVLGAALIVAGRSSHWARGGALAALVAAALLMRNENFIAVALFAAFVAFAALWQRSKVSIRRLFAGRIMLAYLAPLALVGLLTAYYYHRASDAGTIRSVLRDKHVVNVCQIYAFGYQQRYSDFTKSPWTECQELMTRVYGAPFPSLTEALLRNPPAMLEHLGWNFSLIPNGVQVLLFGMTFGRVNPDYAAVRTSWVALPLTGLMVAVLAAGAAMLVRNRKQWWECWLQQRAWGWLLLLALSAAAFVVMVTQRPRPSYLFAFGIFLRAAVGMCLFIIVQGRPWRQRMPPVIACAAILTIVLIPPYYPGPYVKEPRLLARDYARLAGGESVLRKPGSVLVAPLSGWQLCDYLGKGLCKPAYYFDLRAQVTGGKSWRDVLEGRGATLIYADESVLDDPGGARLVREAAAAGWQTLAFRNDGAEHWIFMGRPGTAPSQPGALSGVTAPVQSGDIPVIGDWNGDGRSKVGVFRNGVWLLDFDGARQFSESKAIGWGQAGDIPVVGDWNGDGRTKIGVFRGGTWYLDVDGSHRLVPSKIVVWGSAGDTPVVGDWNGKRKVGIGVFQSGSWLLDTAGARQIGSGDRFTPELR